MTMIAYYAVTLLTCNMFLDFLLFGVFPFCFCSVLFWVEGLAW